MSRLSPKKVLIIGLLLALLLFVFQNFEPVPVQFLFLETRMPAVVLIFLMLGTGMLAGWLLREWKLSRATAKEDEAEPEAAGGAGAEPESAP